MLFRSEESSLKLEIVNYEFREGEGAANSDDQNWLVLRAAYTDGEGRLVKDSNSCLLTYELRELATGLKVLCAGVKDHYESDFVEPYFEVAAQAQGEEFLVSVAFTLPNTMEDMDEAMVEAVMTRAELRAVVDELEAAAGKFPDRVSNPM